jgi:hypothetical protein
MDFKGIFRRDVERFKLATYSVRLRHYGASTWSAAYDRQGDSAFLRRNGDALPYG